MYSWVPRALKIFFFSLAIGLLCLGSSAQFCETLEIDGGDRVALGTEEVLPLEAPPQAPQVPVDQNQLARAAHSHALPFSELGIPTFMAPVCDVLCGLP